MTNNLNKIAIFTIIALAIFTGASTVSAETDTEATASTSPRRLPVKIQQIKANAEARKDERNARIEERKDLIEERREVIKKEVESRKENARKMRRDVFEIRRNAIIRELNQSIENLTDLQTRALARLDKSRADGNNVTEAEALFDTANSKLVKAKADVAAFIDLSSTASSSSSTEIDLAKPRELSNTATQSVKAAREAFKKAVVALAHTLGKKEGRPATATSTSATTTTN